MSTTSFSQSFKVDNVLVDVTSAKLSDPTGAYGIKRNDTDAVIVADGTVLTHDSTGVYSYSFTDPADSLVYTAWVEFVYAGATYRRELTLYGGTPTTVSLDPYALASVNSVKLARRLTSTTFDNLIAQCINQATSILEHAADRQFAARNYHEWAWDMGRNIILSQTPVNRVVAIRYGNSPCLNVKCSLSVIEATVEVHLDDLTLRSVATDGTESVTTLSFDTYKSASALAAAFSDASAVPAGWTATMQTGAGGNCLSRQFKPIAGARCETSAGATLNAAITDIGVDHQLDAEAGLLAINYIAPTPNWLPLLIVYNAGYATIPAGLQKICIDVALGIFDRLGRIAGLQGRTLGDYSESFAVLMPMAVADLNGLTPEQYGLLARYSEISVGKTQ